MRRLYQEFWTVTKSQRPTAEFLQLHVSKTKANKAIQWFMDMIVEQVENIEETIGNSRNHSL